MLLHIQKKPNPLTQVCKLFSCEFLIQDLKTSEIAIPPYFWWIYGLATSELQAPIFISEHNFMHLHSCRRPVTVVMDSMI